MSNLRTLPLALAVLAAALAVLVLAPTAAAVASDTTTQITVTPYDQPIKPLSGFAAIPISVQYCFTAGVGTVPTAVALTVAESPPWAVASISPGTLYLQVVTAGADTAQKCVTGQARMLVSTTADAPAFTPANLRVSAAAAQNGDLKPSTGADQTQIQADFFSIIDASAAQTIAIARPQTQVTYPITVTNFGNANTKLFFEITSKPEGWQVQEPIPITLEARQQGGKQTSSTVNLNILTPYRNGYLNEVGAVTMKVTSNYALDTKKPGDATQVSVLTTTRGFYVPGFETVALVGAVAGLAVVLRRK